MFRYAVYLIFILQLFNCEKNLSDTNNEEFNPCVTGIHITNKTRPYGNGESYGQPSYSLDSNFVMVPNPFTVDNDPTGPGTVGRGHNKITFVINSNIKQIELYKINYSNNPQDALADSSNLSRLQQEFIPVHILTQPADSDRFVWFVIDQGGTLFPSGFYRALVINNDEEVIYWFDIYLIQPLDNDTWIDPTGWLVAPG